MKKQRYIVEIEMPDGDFIPAGWLKDLIQIDCDEEDEGRNKVTVQETSLPSNLDEAAREFAKTTFTRPLSDTPEQELIIIEPDKLAGFKAGAEWMANSGIVTEAFIRADGMGVPMIHFYDDEVKELIGDEVVVQIRKK